MNLFRNSPKQVIKEGELGEISHFCDLGSNTISSQNKESNKLLCLILPQNQSAI